MQEMKISSDIPRSTARRMAEDQLRSLVEVRREYQRGLIEYSNLQFRDFRHLGAAESNQNPNSLADVNFSWLTIVAVLSSFRLCFDKLLKPS